MYTIGKRFTFAASHQLDHLPEGHKCRRLHGHNYVVEVVLQSETLDGWGFVRDFGDLAPLRQFIGEKLDHRHLNDILPGYATSENLARWLFDFASSQWPEVAAVRVSESPNTWAEYRPGQGARSPGQAQAVVGDHDSGD